MDSWLSPLRRFVPSLTCLALAAAFGVPEVQAETGDGAPKSQNEKPDTATAESAEPDASLKAEVQADGSRLFQFHPIWNASQKLKEKLKQYGLTYTLQMAFYNQYASDVTVGQHDYGTYSWLFATTWRFLRTEEHGALFIDATLLGSPGLNYDPATELITRNVGSISELNGNIYPDPAALDELLLKYVSPSTRYGGAIGKIDLSNRFDTNRVANSSFRQFTAFALQNNLSIPWPVYGGIGAFVHTDLREHHYVMVGTAASIVDQPFEFGSHIDDGNLYQLLEIGTQIDVPSLGVGNYRLTPWHARILDDDGWGFGFNFDQELFDPDVVAFFRFGLGDQSATPVETFLSGGLTWLRPWGRAHDMLGLGVAWSNPSPDEGDRNETLIELFYRYSIFPWVQLGPDLQIIHHPANDAGRGTVFVGGIRLYLSL